MPATQHTDHRPRQETLTKQRHAREKITGTDDLTVSEAGTVYRHWRRQELIREASGRPPGRHYIAVYVDVGEDYRGPVPAQGCTKRCPGCEATAKPLLAGGKLVWAQDPNDHVPSRLRLLDEIVAFEFLERPDGWGWLSFSVHHIDGDSENCAANNLLWAPIRNPQTPWRHTRPPLPNLSPERKAA
jgi:hypothetical protein